MIEKCTNCQGWGFNKSAPDQKIVPCGICGGKGEISVVKVLPIATNCEVCAYPLNWVHANGCTKIVKQAIDVETPKLAGTLPYKVQLAEVLGDYKIPEGYEVVDKLVVMPATGKKYCLSCKNLHLAGEYEMLPTEIHPSFLKRRSETVVSKKEPRSQKARGVFALVRTKKYNVPRTVLVQSREEIPDAVKAIINPAFGQTRVFVRPCPTVPRHGFVDSRIVTGLEIAKISETIEKIFDEAIAADPGAELMICEPIDARSNAIITPQSASIGPGNDGATSGKDCLSIPLAHVKIPSVNMAEAGITETPYMEVVFEGMDDYRFTQIRNGPEIKTKADFYIPKKVTVTDVWTVDPGEDALAYEARIANAPEGVAIYHPGGSLISHYAVHAKLRGLPIFLNRKPEVGEVLIPPKEQKEARYDIAAFKRGIEAGFTPRQISWESLLSVALLTTHQATEMQNDLGSWAIGFSAAWLVRFGLAASFGELRHKSHKEMGFKVKNRSRHDIYGAILDGPLPNYGDPAATFNSFANERWPNGYGGPAWAICALATIRLDGLLRRALRRGSQDEVKAVIGAMNNVVNCAHNGGWFMNKFVPQELFDMHADGDVRAIATSVNNLFTVFNGIERYKKFIDADLAAVLRWKDKPASRLQIPRPARERLTYRVKPIVELSQYFANIRVIDSRGNKILDQVYGLTFPEYQELLSNIRLYAVEEPKTPRPGDEYTISLDRIPVSTRKNFSGLRPLQRQNLDSVISGLRRKAEEREARIKEEEEGEMPCDCPDCIGD